MLQAGTLWNNGEPLLLTTAVYFYADAQVLHPVDRIEVPAANLSEGHCQVDGGWTGSASDEVGVAGVNVIRLPHELTRPLTRAPDRTSSSIGFQHWLSSEF